MPQFTELPALAPHVTVRHLDPGEVLFREGEEAAYVYQVREGLLKLSRGSTVGRDVITELLCPGDCCDVPALFDDHPYTVTGAALSQRGAVVLCVPRAVFLQQRPQTLERLLAGWWTRLQFQREMMVAIAVERAEVRAARVLQMLRERLGSPQMPLTRQEFSELIGTTMETAIRVLGRLKREQVAA